jgi:hypothetical protein
VGTTACGSACVNTTTGQCCAEAATSLVGEFFNGGCFAGTHCQLKLNTSAGVISIAGQPAADLPALRACPHASMPGRVAPRRPPPKEAPLLCWPWLAHPPCSGRRCADAPTLCRECCADADCPDSAIGQK